MPADSDYFLTLEARAAQCRLEDLYLWPRTPLGPDLQDEIRRCVGVGDADPANRSSRPSRIVRLVSRLAVDGNLPMAFAVCDLACGDGLVLAAIKRTFPDARCSGLDCRAGTFATHSAVCAVGVRLHQGYLQHAFAIDPPSPFDVVIMLNTYRGWDSADLRSHEQDLPRQADLWLGRNARYAIVTATAVQIRGLKRAGFNVARLGPGEDASVLVCFSRLPIPQPFGERLLASTLSLWARATFRRVSRRWERPTR